LTIKALARAINIGRLGSAAMGGATGTPGPVIRGAV
jgi:hypothetical protein